MDYRVELLSKRHDRFRQVKTLDLNSWPEFLLHGDMPSWDAIYSILADYVILLIDADDQLAAAGFTIPAVWNGQLEELPDSIESIVSDGVKVRDAAPDTLMAVAAMVDARYRGHHLSAEVLKQMTQLARRHALGQLLVPVRPVWKSRYPLQDITSYAHWRRADGMLFDPWLRTHLRLGARLLKCVPSTVSVIAPIEKWETWTGMIFPDSGPYIVKGALQPVFIDRAANLGTYHDPNVWMQHTVPD
jgi:hypothetical protein